jgi:KDO2-lipid IV(A) lauroyltransferase
MTIEERLGLVWHCFGTLGTLLGDAVALLRPRSESPALCVSTRAQSLFEEARNARRAVIFVSAHLGPWERVAVSLVRAGIPLVTIARESYDPRFNRLYEKLRTLHGVGVVWRDQPGAVGRIVRTLRSGGVLGVPMDLRSRAPSCDVDFMGCAAPTAVGPARLALRTRAHVLVGSIAPAADGGVEVTATGIETRDLQAGDDGAHVLTERINAELSRRILSMPHAWVWMHERWPDGNRI